MSAPRRSVPAHIRNRFAALGWEPPPPSQEPPQKPPRDIVFDVLRVKDDTEDLAGLAKALAKALSGKAPTIADVARRLDPGKFQYMAEMFNGANRLTENLTVTTGYYGQAPDGNYYSIGAGINPINVDLLKRWQFDSKVT